MAIPIVGAPVPGLPGYYYYSHQVPTYKLTAEKVKAMLAADTRVGVGSVDKWRENQLRQLDAMLRAVAYFESHPQETRVMIYHRDPKTLKASDGVPSVAISLVQNKLVEPAFNSRDGILAGVLAVFAALGAALLWGRRK